MKNLIQFLQTGLLIMFVFSLTANAQTPVSGGIYSNTTWALANSPYIVTDTVVVFPGVTLTIEPGVTVKFYDSTRLEIREARILAEGTSTDSITFTSNLVSPTPGTWLGIVMNGTIAPSFTSKYNYCNISYADRAIDASWLSGTLNLRNSKIDYNNYGIYYSQIDNLIDSCIFTNNVFTAQGLSNGMVRNTIVINNTYGFYTGGNITFQDCIFRLNQIGLRTGSSDNILTNCIINSNSTGLIDNSGYTTIKNSIIDSNSNTGLAIGIEDTVYNCQIRNNNIGLYSFADNSMARLISRNVIEYNTFGVKFESSLNNFYCNKICNNSAYDIFFNALFSNNIDLSNNYWCTEDSAIITAHIYDGYDNINLGLVNLMPIDTMGCYLTAGISTHEFNKLSISIYPNPVSDHITIILSKDISESIINIYNLLGQVKRSVAITMPETILDVSELPNGVYILELISANNISRQKFIKK